MTFYKWLEERISFARNNQDFKRFKGYQMAWKEENYPDVIFLGWERNWNNLERFDLEHEVKYFPLFMLESNGDLTVLVDQFKSPSDRYFIERLWGYPAPSFNSNDKRTMHKSYVRMPKGDKQNVVAGVTKINIESEKILSHDPVDKQWFVEKPAKNKLNTAARKLFNKSLAVATLANQKVETRHVQDACFQITTSHKEDDLFFIPKDVTYDDFMNETNHLRRLAMLGNHTDYSPGLFGGRLTRSQLRKNLDRLIINKMIEDGTAGYK